MQPDVSPATFAASTRALLSEDPRRYRAFGVYWPFVKALLKRFYDRHEMPILGDYVDQATADRMPPAGSLQEAISGAIEEYGANASLNLGSNKVEDPDGEFFFLTDPDIDS